MCVVGGGGGGEGGVEESANHESNRMAFNDTIM